MKNLAFIILLLLNTPCFSQYSQEEQHQIDSLDQIINTPSAHDTSRASAIVEITGLVYQHNVDTVIPLCNMAIEIANRRLLEDLSAPVQNSLQKTLSGALNNIGFIHQQQGNIPAALDYYHESMKIEEKLGNMLGVASSLNNIGMIYDDQGELHVALEYYERGLHIKEKLGSEVDMLYSLNNIGMIYYEQAQYEKALFYFKRCVKLENSQENKTALATTLNNIGLIHSKLDNIPLALEFFHHSLDILKRQDNHIGMTSCLNNIGSLELETHDYVNAKSHLELGLRYAKEIGSPHWISLNSANLYKLEKATGNYEHAFKLYELHVHMRDSITSTETQKAVIRQQTKYEFEKAALLREQIENDAIRLLKEKLKRRDNLQYSIIFISLLLIFSGVLGVGFVNVSNKVIEGLIFFSFLILFEFVLVLADPYIEKFSGGGPGYTLLFNAALAGCIFPIHSICERVLKARLIQNNRENSKHA